MSASKFEICRGFDDGSGRFAKDYLAPVKAKGFTLSRARDWKQYRVPIVVESRVGKESRCPQLDLITLYNQLHDLHDEVFDMLYMHGL